MDVEEGHISKIVKQPIQEHDKILMNRRPLVLTLMIDEF